MFSSKFAMPALVFAVLGLAAVPVAMALADTADDGLVSVEGVLKEFVCCDDDCDECDRCFERASAFILETDDGDLVRVEFGPWWYWLTQEVTVKDVVGVDDRIKVTGESAEEDGMAVMDAWVIENLDTDEDITIKVEGRPPWAGGPIKLGIDPWPPSDEED